MEIWQPMTACAFLSTNTNKVLRVRRVACLSNTLGHRPSPSFRIKKSECGRNKSLLGISKLLAFKPSKEAMLYYSACCRFLFRRRWRQENMLSAEDMSKVITNEDGPQQWSCHMDGIKFEILSLIFFPRTNRISKKRANMFLAESNQPPRQDFALSHHIVDLSLHSFRVSLGFHLKFL